MPKSVQGSNVLNALDSYESQRAQAIQQISTNDSEVVDYNATAMAKKLFSFEMGLEVYSYTYEETVEGDHFMDLKGNFEGFFTKVAWNLQKQPVGEDAWQENKNEWADLIDQLSLEARMAFAKLDYTGGVSDGAGFEQEITLSDTPDMVAEVRLLGSKDFTWQGITITPFSGFGFRYLRDDSSDQSVTIDYYGTPTTIEAGYVRKSHYYYLPIGVTISKLFANSWYLGLTAEFDQLISGTQKSCIETTDGRVPTNTQNQGYGMRCSLRLEKQFDKFGIMIEPFYRYWDIEDSDISVYWLMEPSNTTKEGGLKVGITF